MAATVLKNQAFTSVDLDAWNSFTPTWTNLTIGNGTTAGYYCQIGKTVFGRIYYKWGSTTSASGAISFALPVAARATDGSRPNFIGAAYLRDNSAGGVYTQLDILSTGGFFVTSTDGTYATKGSMTHAVPVTQDDDDEVFGTFTYEAA
jgi:hypothetical protein